MRALRILNEVAVIAAEDTRTTRRLLDHHGVRAKLTALTEHNTARAVPRLLAVLDTGDVAVVSEAGTPAISDPGRALVTAAIAAEHTVTALPGASAVLAALVSSGLPAREFTYLGFLPRGGSDRRRLLAAAAREPRTLVLFESPHRLRAALADIAAAFGNRPLAVCRELTKLYEEIYRGTAADALGHFAEPRGEFTLVLAGAPGLPVSEMAGDMEAVTLAELAVLKRAGHHAKDATAIVSERTGLPRRALYDAWTALPDEDAGDRR